MSTAAATAAVETEPPRLVFFYDERSGQSRRAEGFLAHVLQRGANQKTFRILRVEVGQRPDLADRFAVTAAPTLLVVSDRKVQARLECPRGCRDIELLLKPWLRSTGGITSAEPQPPRVPEPGPVPSDPPGPVIVPEPEPVPSDPPGPVIVPEPEPVPHEPPPSQSAARSAGS
jgi:hypothetical protein